jgi:hypothetical protein
MGCILNACDYSGSGQEQDYHNENRNDRPRKFQLSTPINLDRLKPFFRSPRPELYGGIGKQAENNYEDG